MDEDKILLLFTRKIYPEVDPGPEGALIRRLEDAIFSERDDVDPHISVLVALPHHANILKVGFEKKRLKDRKRRIEQLAVGEFAAAATKEAIAAMRAAVMIAVILPSTIY